MKCYAMVCFKIWENTPSLQCTQTSPDYLEQNEFTTSLQCTHIHFFKCICFQIKTNKTKFKSCCLLCYGMILRMRIYESLCWCIRFQWYAIRIYFYAMRFHCYAMRFQCYTVLWGMFSKICLYWHMHKFCLLNVLLTKIALQYIKGAWLHNYCM